MGWVYLIGAGPGDRGLYTLRAKELIERADVIIYDYLANRAFLSWTKKGCEIIYAGKQGGHHTLSQTDINKLLVKKAREHNIVVRLKGGDPYIFGRGGEEAEHLVKNGIGFEVVPGVSSAYAAPAYAGIPLTHRRFSSSVTFVTGHEAEEKEESVLDWSCLVRSASTLVFFMGVKNLPLISRKLISAGMDPNTPAALVQWGTTCKHRSISSSIEEIPSCAKKASITPPALLVVGEVVSLKEELNFFEKRPLLGSNVIITRARAQAGRLSSLLEKKGACCIEFPTIKIVPLTDYSPLKRAIEGLQRYDWLIFTSVNGVKYFFSVLHEMGFDTRRIGNTKVCAIGPATEKRLESFGIRADFVPPRYIAEEIAMGLRGKGIEGGSVLIPRAKRAREVLPRMLKEMGCKVEVIPVYETALEESGKEDIITLLEEKKAHYITFTSSSTVENFFNLIPVEIVKKAVEEGITRIAAIGPITASTVEGFGLSVHILPSSYTIESLVEAIKRDQKNFPDSTS